MTSSLAAVGKKGNVFFLNEIASKFRSSCDCLQFSVWTIRVRRNCEVTGGRAGLCLTSDEMRGMEVWGENVVECVGWNMFVTPRGPVEGV